MNWLSPKDIEKTFKISRAKAYRLLKEYRDRGYEVLKIGSQSRVPETRFTEFLEQRK